MAKSKPNIERLAAAIAAVKNHGEAKSFIGDLLTEEEKRSLTKRLHIADWLTAGKTYEQIVSGIGTSMTTVARVSHWLKNAGQGYRITAERVQLSSKAKSNATKRSRSASRSTGQKSKSQKASLRRRSSRSVVRGKKRR